MPPTGTFEYDIRARCSVADAIALMADIPRLTSRHPLAIRVKDLPSSGGVLRTTAVTSRLKAGPLRFHITYRAYVLAITKNEVITVAIQRPRTTLMNRARFRREDGGITHIAVEITFTAPALLFPYAFGQARFAHAGLAVGIKDMLEAPNSVDE